MYWDVTSVDIVGPLRLKVTFSDGLKGELEFRESHLEGVFEVLKDEVFFNQVYVSRGVVTWPGGLDLAPDAMYAEIKKSGVWVLE